MAKVKENPKIEPWERQEGETTKAFEAFVIYRDLGTDRSLEKVGKRLGKSSTMMARWSSSNNWVKRVEEYDRELDRISIIENKKVIKDMNIRQAKTAMNIQGKMLQALNQMEITGLKPNDISRLIEIGLKYERIARGADAITQQSDETINQKPTLADTIVAAYKRRKEDEDNA